MVSNSILNYVTKSYDEVKKLAQDEKKPKDNLVEFSMFISKANLDNNGKMLWAATGSDTGLDSFDEKMSVRLYKSFLKNIESGINLPIYLSLAHYPRLGGKGEVGVATEVYIDGNQLKAKGYFNDNSLGRSVYNSIRSDRRNNVDSNNRVRISIGFYDRMHSHSNGTVWKYEPNKPCTQCALKINGKEYLEGILEHFAVTRVPVNRRTDIIAKSESESMTTRYEDALSIVGESAKSDLDEIEKATREERIQKAETVVSKGKGTSEANPAAANGVGDAADLNVPDISEDAPASTPRTSTFDILSGLPKEKLIRMIGKMEMDGTLTTDAISELINQVLNQTTDRSLTEKTTVVGKEVMAEKPDKKKKMDVKQSVDPSDEKISTSGWDESYHSDAKRDDVDPADKKRAVKEYGNVAYADAENKKYPIDTPEHIRAAWNYIHQAKNAAKYSDEGASIKKRITAAWKEKISKDGPPSTQKADVERCDDDDDDDDYFSWQPFGGATSFQEAQEYMDAAKMESNVYMAYSTFGALASNILTDKNTDIADKSSAMQALLSDFSKQLDPKELMKMSKAAEQEKTAENKKSPAANKQEKSDYVDDGRSYADTQPDSVKLLGAMQELINKISALLDRPASVATTGNKVGPAPDGTWDENSPVKTDTVNLDVAGGNQGNFTNPATGQQTGPEPKGSWDENSPMKSIVSDFEGGLQQAATKSGDERLLAMQEVINKAANNMKSLHQTLASAEPTPEQPKINLNETINRALDEKLVPVQAQMAEIANLVKGLSLSKSTVSQPKREVEIPKMKSIVNYTDAPKQVTKGKSIMDIATETTFGTTK